MEDKELFEQLARGPLTRNGFNESLRRKINESIDMPKRKSSRPWFIRWRALSASLLLIVVVAVGFTSWRSLNHSHSNKQSLLNEQATASSQVTNEKEINPIPHSAVVIGLRDDSVEDGPSTYRTILVAPQDGRIANMGSGTGIYMPYKTNFWKIDTVQDALGKGLQTIVASRAGQKWPETNGSEKISPLRRSEKLLYAGNQFVSILQTTNVNETGDSVDQSQVWINEVVALDPLERAKNVNALEETHFPLAKALDTYGAEAGIDQWVITREASKWIAKKPIIASSLTNVSEIRSWPTIPVQLTENIVKDAPLAISWDEVQKLEPTAKDAFTSQDEDILAIVTDNSIKLYPYRLPEAEMKAITIPISTNESVVMVQWATRQVYVENWIKMFSKWFPASAN
jgi:hypothetical protein